MQDDRPLDRALDALPRVALAHLPTPLMKIPALDARLGVDLWIKRDDVTAGAESGNKARKLELLLGAALAEGADTVVTCGGIQSNHARATAIAAARLGLKCVLLLRMNEPKDPLPLSGNVFLDRLVGAEIRKIDHAQWRERDALMEAFAAVLRSHGRRPFIIPEGGSNGLGSLGYVLAMRELEGQLAVGLGGGAPFDVVAHACGSGGTAAGLALGIGAYGVARRLLTFAVCDDRAYFEARIASIVLSARSVLPSLPAALRPEIDDTAKGPAYAVSTAAQRELIVDVARASGLILDPVYTGKAFFGLAQAIARGEVKPGSRVLFVHTGGLPGLLADADAFHAEV
jgi:D-cysteine desulfhydrase